MGNKAYKVTKEVFEEYTNENCTHWERITWSTPVRWNYFNALGALIAYYYEPYDKDNPEEFVIVDERFDPNKKPT